MREYYRLERADSSIRSAGDSAVETDAKQDWSKCGRRAGTGTRRGRDHLRDTLLQSSASAGVRWMARKGVSTTFASLCVQPRLMSVFHLFRCAVRCLQYLSRCTTFFHNRCVILGVEPLLRVTSFLAENSAAALVQATAIHLLSDMLTK